MRDLGESDLWIERYHVSTWLDYIRHNQRRTVADIANASLEQSSGIEQINKEIEESTSDYDREKLQERVAKLAGGVAVNDGREIEDGERGQGRHASILPRRGWPCQPEDLRVARRRAQCSQGPSRAS